MKTIPKRKKQRESFLKSRIVSFLLLFLAILLLNSSIKMYLKSQEAGEYLNSTQEEYLSLKKQYDDAKEDLEYLNSSTGLEKEIRSKFDLVREGEKAILIIEEELPEIQEPKKKGFWGKIKSFVTF
jgi:type II secretory pathway pseudopilin PulG